MACRPCHRQWRQPVCVGSLRLSVCRCCGRCFCGWNRPAAACQYFAGLRLFNIAFAALLRFAALPFARAISRVAHCVRPPSTENPHGRFPCRASQDRPEPGWLSPSQVSYHHASQPTFRRGDRHDWRSPTLWYADTWRLSSPCPASLTRRNLRPSACQYLFLLHKEQSVPSADTDHAIRLQNTQRTLKRLHSIPRLLTVNPVDRTRVEPSVP